MIRRLNFFVFFNIVIFNIWFFLEREENVEDCIVGFMFRFIDNIYYF